MDDDEPCLLEESHYPWGRPGPCRRHGVGLYTWVNILALVLLSPIAIRLVKDYDRQKREGKDPVLDPKAIGVHNAHLWESLHGEFTRTGDADHAMNEVADSAPDTAAIAIVNKDGVDKKG